MKKDYIYKNYYIWRGTCGYYFTRTPKGAQLFAGTLKAIKFLINGSLDKNKTEVQS